MVLVLFGVQWVMPRRVIDLLGVLAREFGETSKHCHLEGHPPLLHVVSMEGMQHENF